ncbi:MAG: hypothetical protein OXI96_07660 [Acidimicrobiaceae bacterium]|nr:hypothetical protein [Acidimicrobiaceae bacterium]
MSGCIELNDNLEAAITAGRHRKLAAEHHVEQLESTTAETAAKAL